MRVLLVYLVAVAMLLSISHAMCNDEEQDPQAGMENIPPAMTLKRFKPLVSSRFRSTTCTIIQYFNNTR